MNIQSVRPATQNLTWPEYNSLLTAGVDKRLLAGLYASRNIWAGTVDGERVVFLSEGAAFRLDKPKQFWATTTNPFIGQESLERSIHFQEPLLVHETPLDWLKADREGIVILSWEHYWPLYLADVPTLRTLNVAFGRRLSAALKHPLPLPEIQVAA